MFRTRLFGLKTVVQKHIIIIITFAILLTNVKSIKYSSKYNDESFPQKWNEKLLHTQNNNNNVTSTNKSVLNMEFLRQFIKEYNAIREEIIGFSPLVENNIRDKNDSSDSVEKIWPVRIFNCVGNRGLGDCLKIFFIQRMDRIQRIIKSAKISENVSIDFDLKSEIEQDFKWETYKQFKESDLDKLMFKNYKDLLKDKTMKLFIYPGIAVDLRPEKNGSVILDIKRDPDMQLPRGMKFPKKAFYRILPMLLIPPLIMSAILPFILPALKMMIMGVGMLNLMALMGAIFTLMRNNAFSDSYDKKVIYVNSGYKNEKKHTPNIHHDIFHPHTHREGSSSFNRPNFQYPPLHGFKAFPDVTTPAYDGDMFDISDSYSEHQNKFPPNFNTNHFKEEEFEEGERYSNNFEEEYNRGNPGNKFKKYG